MNRKPIFDSVRAMLGRGFKQSEVAALDRAIDRATGVETEAPEWVPLASALIREYEGYARELPNGDCQAYPDPGTGGKPWTIGFGSTTDEHGAPIDPGTVWTRDRAEARFEEHLREFGEGVCAGQYRAFPPCHRQPTPTATF